LDLSSQIHGVLGFFMLALLLLWSELGVEGKTNISVNKVVSVSALVIQVDAPLLAGHGGEGVRLSGEVCVAATLLLAGRGGMEERRSSASSFAST
jgi:hypothetical protein